jgi:hypothetical protein
MKISVSCHNCKKEFLKEKSQIISNNFCSRNCAAIHNNKTPKRKLSNKCKLCNNLCRADRTYCSMDCYKEFVKLNKKEGKRKNKWVKTYIKRLKVKCIEYKGGSCKICGYNKCIGALEFHHRNPNKKEFNISGRSIKFEKIKVELDKCDLVCCNCHRELHEELNK